MYPLGAMTNTRKHRREGQSKESADELIGKALFKRQRKMQERAFYNERSARLNPAWNPIPP